jgi:hypothetical protein
MLAGSQHAVPGRPMLIQTYHAVPMPFPCCSHAATMPRPCHGHETSLSERHIRGMVGERHGMCESNTAALCKPNKKDTI